MAFQRRRTRPATTPLRWWERIWLALMILAIIAVIVWFLLQPTVLGGLLGDPAKEVLAIDNRTDQRLVVFLVYPDGSEHPSTLIPALPPHTRTETGLPCGAGELVARTPEGAFVAGRGPFEECNLEDWVIGSGE